MRRNIFPECEACYGNIFMENLYNLGKQSETLNTIIYDLIVTPIFNEVKFGSVGFIIKKNDNFSKYLILELVFRKICFKLNIKHLKRKSLFELFQKMNSNNLQINLISEYKTLITNDYILFLKDEHFNNIIKIHNEFNDVTIVQNNDNKYFELVDGIVYYPYYGINTFVANDGHKSKKYPPLYNEEIIKRNLPKLYGEKTKIESNNFIRIDFTIFPIEIV